MAEESLTRLPQYDGCWYTGFRRIPAWLKKEGTEDELFQPWVIFVVDITSGAIIQLSLLDEYPEQNELHQFFFRCMTSPSENSIRPQRPKEIHFEFEGLITELQPFFSPLNITTIHNPQPEVVEDILAHLIPSITGGQVPLLGLMEQYGVTKKLFKNLFILSKTLWDLKPWQRFENDDILAVSVGNQKNPYFVSMMGYGGMEFGFAVFKNLSELKTFFVQTELKFFNLPANGRHVFLFNKPPLVSFSDLHYIEKYDLPLPEDGFIPTPLWFKPDDLYRPSTQMLRWYDAFLSVFPLFFSDFTKNEAALFNKTYTVTTSKEETTVKIEIPAFEKDLINQWKLDGTYDFLGGIFSNLN